MPSFCKTIILFFFLFAMAIGLTYWVVTDTQVSDAFFEFMKGPMRGR